MMMTRAAGGANLSAILDHRQSGGAKRRTWATLLVMALAAHTGVGIYLYQSRFSIPDMAQPTAPTTTVYMVRPVIMPPKPRLDPAPVSAPSLNRPTVITPSIVAPLEVPHSDVTTTVIGPAINLTQAGNTADSTPMPTHSTERAPAVITHPDWVQRPTAQQMMRAYPARALDLGVEGSAQLNCAVHSDGRLNDCRVLSETPERQGFGRAATNLSTNFKMSPRTEDGHAVDGARVTFGIRFALTD